MGMNKLLKQAGMNKLLKRWGLKRQTFGLKELDLKIAKMLGEMRNGFFIEVGANDGLSQSNTMYLERYLGWGGLLIEAIPELAEICEKKRPKATVIHAALVPFGYQHESIQMLHSGVHLGHHGLMWIIKGSRGSEEVETAIVYGKSYEQGAEAYVVEAPTRTLQSIMDENKILHVDLFSLDVEGFEPQVLRGIDFDRVTFSNLVIEVRNMGEVLAALSGRYRVVSQLSHHDYLFRPNY